VWTVFVGPFLSLLPARWRKQFNLSSSQWKVAASISGVCEAVASLTALVAWYSYSVATWAHRAIFSTIDAHPEAAIPADTVGFAALVLLLFHPFTLFILYWGVEGIVRFLAGLSGSVLGILPIYLMDRLYILVSSRQPVSSLITEGPALRNLKLSDELAARSDSEGEILEIRSFRPKTGWDPPKIVCFKGVYYRLFQAYEERSAHRPFIFSLRRLTAGVPSRTVIYYSEEDESNER
jgi:hypothetical protein